MKKKLKNIENITLLNLAIWNKKGEMEIYTSSDRSAHSMFKSEMGVHSIIKTNTIDNILLEMDVKKVDFLKMDIEGSEIEALEGAINALKIIPKIAIAAYHIRDGKKTLDRVDKTLRDNYYITWINSDGIVYGYNPSLIR